MNDKAKELVGIGCGVLIFVALIGGGVGWKWYQAGLQQQVYRRQGVEMTQWEVFNGAKPVERYVKP